MRLRPLGYLSAGYLHASRPLVVSRCALPVAVFPARSHAPVLLPCSLSTARSALAGSSAPRSQMHLPDIRSARLKNRRQTLREQLQFPQFLRAKRRHIGGQIQGEPEEGFFSRRQQGRDRLS